MSSQAQFFFHNRFAAVRRGLGALIGVVVPLLLLSPASGVAEIQIVYQVEDRPDVDPSQDLWRYSYTVQGRAFSAFEGFSIDFEPDRVDSLTLVSAPNTGWIADTINPDRFFAQPGLLLGQATEDLPASVWEFTVDFIWLGDGVPGSQRYELFDADFNPLDPPGVLGTVAQPIPEPQTAQLVLAGLTLLAVICLRRRHLSRRE